MKMEEICVSSVFAKEWVGGGHGRTKVLGTRRDLGYAEESSLTKAFYGVARSRIVGTVYLLLPEDLQEPGNASTPSLPFCQLAFLLT